MVNYRIDSGHSNPVFIGEDSFGHFPGNVFSTDSPNIFFCKLGSVLLPFGMNASALAFSIIGIVLKRTKEEMKRIHTAWIVTSVANLIAYWYQSICFLVSELMSLEVSFTIPKIPISKGVMGTSPFPAIIWAFHVNFIPKSLRDGFITFKYMALNVFPGLAFGQSPCGYIDAGDFSSLPTPTLTKALRNFFVHSIALKGAAPSISGLLATANRARGDMLYKNKNSLIQLAVARKIIS